MLEDRRVSIRYITEPREKLARRKQRNRKRNGGEEEQERLVVGRSGGDADGLRESKIEEEVSFVLGESEPKKKKGRYFILKGCLVMTKNCEGLGERGRRERKERKEDEARRRGNRGEKKDEEESEARGKDKDKIFGISW